MIDIEQFIREYVTTLLWSENVDDIDAEPDEYGERPLIPADDRYSIDDIDDAGIKEIREDCSAFLAECAHLLERAYEGTTFDPCGDGAHNFCLSRNGHGAGFWDRGLGALGDELHDAAKVYGTQGLMAFDDGTLGVHG
jgi:hypothetical protein